MDLGVLLERYQLAKLVHRVLIEERRRRKVILCEIASQILVLFGESLPDEDQGLGDTNCKTRRATRCSSKHTCMSWRG